MTEFFLALIIVCAFICTLTVIIGIKSSSKVFPIISVCCAVMIISFALFASIELKTFKPDVSPTKAYIPSAAETKAEKTEKKKSSSSETEENHETVYITRTGTKYHYSYNCSDSDFYECTLEEALERGLEPCGRCVK